jgi:hypothetical protein
MVTGMKNLRLLKEGFLKGRMLRLLGISKAFEQPFSGHGAVVLQAHSQSSRKGSPDPFFNVKAYLISSAHKHEVETQKARVIAESRHHSWKAGGPN